MPQPSEKQRQAGLWHPRENWATTLQAKSFLGQNEGVEFLPKGKESHSKPKTKVWGVESDCKLQREKCEDVPKSNGETSGRDQIPS